MGHVLRLRDTEWNRIEARCRREFRDVVAVTTETLKNTYDKTFKAALIPYEAELEEVLKQVEASRKRKRRSILAVCTDWIKETITEATMDYDDPDDAEDNHHQFAKSPSKKILLHPKYMSGAPTFNRSGRIVGVSRSSSSGPTHNGSQTNNSKVDPDADEDSNQHDLGGSEPWDADEAHKEECDVDSDECDSSMDEIAVEEMGTGRPWKKAR
jgi:hypothetical protein